jgi:flavin-dependent thymidylate synthase
MNLLSTSGSRVPALDRDSIKLGSVGLLDYTGAGYAHAGDYAARLLIYIKNTRLEQNGATRAMIASWDAGRVSDELNYIANTIRSSWEFVDYAFQVTYVTRAYTHQQVRTRTASYAQQAQRVVDLSTGFETMVPDTVINADNGKMWIELMEHIRQVYEAYSKQGVPSQDCRGVLPTNVITNIAVKMNLRTLADLVGKRDNPRAQGEYESVVKGMVKRASEVHPWIGPFLYPERTQTPALDQILRQMMGDGSPIDQPLTNAAMKEVDRLKAVWG